MLVLLSIRNFVLIDRADLEPGDGFTALTGETGAGKSILLDALGMALGGTADKGSVRAGTEQASITAAFAPSPDHGVWSVLAEAGIETVPDEWIHLKRVVPAKGAARAFINEQPVGAALLSEIGAQLVEIHGQHAASTLLRPAKHRDLLDRFAGNEALLAKCAEAWDRLEASRIALEETQQRFSDDAAERDELVAACEELARLAPETGEADRLATERTALMQAERVSECLAEAREGLGDGTISDGIARSARALEKINRLAGFDRPDDPRGRTARAAMEAVERALIELQESERSVDELAAFAEDQPAELDRVEARLFALRGAARKYGVTPDDLASAHDTFKARLGAIESGEETVAAAEDTLRSAQAAWHGAADRLGKARRAAATRLEKAVLRELKPLKLGKVQFKVTFELVDDGASGRAGAERAEFEVETSPGAGFGPLRKIASGGELARLSLALKCALADTGGSQVLIFDEADQGVGGAVASAIGERLARLATDRQVFAITHSPQVAARATDQWTITKHLPRKGLGSTRINGLDGGSRLEEIARMLAGVDVTPEARAAAQRLLEEGCNSQSPSAS